MFVDFNKTFKNKTQTRLAVPPALLRRLSDSLPQGFEYALDESGQCVITSKNDSFTIGGFQIAPTSHQLEVLGEHYTYDTVAYYMYNSQQSIPLKLYKDGFITLNGQEVPIERLKFNFFNPIEYKSGSFIMSPPPFPDPFAIKIGCSEFTREISVVRIPSDSITEQVYESDKNAPLYIRYAINKETTALTFSISFKFSSNSTVKDIIESATIYNAFLDGKGTVMGDILDGHITDNSAKKYDEKALEFWKKVLQIESKLQVNFHPNKSETDYNTIYFVEVLYQNLIEHKATVINQNVNEISGKWEKEDFLDSIGKPLYFEFVTPLENKLFGQSISLPCLWGIMNAVLSDYKTKNKEKVITVTDKDSEHPKYTAVLCFLSNEELEFYRNQDHSIIIQNFKDAINPSSII